MGASAGAESIAAWAEGGFKYGTQYLVNPLLYDSVQYRRNTKIACASIRFWYLYSLYRFWFVSSFYQLFFDFRPFLFQVGSKGFYCHVVYACCAFVLPYLSIGLIHVVSFDQTFD